MVLAELRQVPVGIERRLWWLDDGRLADVWLVGPGIHVNLLTPQQAIGAWQLPALLVRLAAHLQPIPPELAALLEKVALALEDGAVALRSAGDR